MWFAGYSFKDLRKEESYTEIINGCKNNNRNTQEILYKDYYKSMMSLCMRYTKNEADAVEVLNTGFMKVFTNISKYDAGKASLYTWISTIVINTCLDFIKSKASRQQYLSLDENVEVEIPADVVSKITTRELIKLVRELPPATQAVFNLYAIEGYPHKDIGKLLGISEGTSKWHLSEAKKSLQQMIQIQKLQAHG